MQHQLSDWRHRLVKAGAALDLVSPLATLTRGYAIVSKKDRVVHAATDIAVGDEVQAKLSDGVLHCLVEKIT